MAINSLRHQLIKGALGSFLIRFLSAGLGFANAVLLARILGVELFGEFSFILSLVTVLVIPAALGFPQLIVRLASSYIENSQWSLARGLLSYSRRMAVLLSMGIILLLAFGYFILGTHSIGMLALVSLFLLALALIQVEGSFLHALHKVILAQIPEMILRPGFLFVVLLILFLGDWKTSSVEDILWIQLGLAVLTAIILFGLTRKLLPPEIYQTAPEFKNQAWLKSALPLAVVGGTSLLNQNVDVLMLGTLAGNEAVGLYRPASRIVMIIGFGISAVNMALRPTIARLFVAEDLPRVQKIVTLASRVNALFVLPLLAILYFFGSQILLIFGEDFVASYSILLILSIAYAFTALIGSAPMLLDMAGKENLTAKGSAIMLILNVILNASLIPIAGPNGAAIATLTSLVLGFLYMAFILAKTKGIHTHPFVRLRKTDSP